MVVRINLGKSVMKILRYNELKRATGDAKLLRISGMLPGAKKLSTYQLAKHFKTFTDLNTRAHTNAMHLSLSFSPKDLLDDQKMEKIAEKYLNKIGFGAQPYLVYRHFDSGHPHLHVVTTIISTTGKRIATHNLWGIKSEPAQKELEVEYGLVKADQQKFIGPDLKSMQKVSYGEQPTKAGLNAVINHVLANYHFNSLAEFNAVLELFNVSAFRGEKDSLCYKNRGLVFHFLDKKGKRIGMPLKASSFYASPTLGRLEKRFAKAIQQKKNHKEEVLGRVLKVMKSQQGQGVSAIDKYIKELKTEGVACRLDSNESGRLYGVTYIDHQSGCIYKGSELNKQLEASGLTEHFGLSEKSQNISLSPIAEWRDSPVYLKNISSVQDFKSSKTEQVSPVTGFIGDISDSPYQGPVYPKKTGKKRKNIAGTEKH